MQNILQEIINHVSKETGKTKSSVMGSSFGSTDKTCKKEWFSKDWYYASSNKDEPARIIKNNTIKKHNKYLNYNTKTKQIARQIIYKELTRFKSPSILTLAGASSVEIKYVFSKRPNAVITNVEKDSVCLKAFKKHRLPVKSFHGTMSEYLSTENTRVDIINYDSMSYLCSYIHDDIKLINKRKLCKYLCLTISAIKKIRNTGEFANKIRSKYIMKKDPTLCCLLNTMKNYTLIEDFEYKRGGEGSRTQKMRILKFKLKS